MRICAPRQSTVGFTGCPWLEMAQFAKILLLILCQLFAFIICTEESNNSLSTEPRNNDIKRLILDSFNDKWDEFTYHSPNIINIHHQNESDNLYLIHLEVSAECKSNASESCVSSDLVCEILVIDDPTTATKQILDGYTLCANKELEFQVPVVSQGFVEVTGKEKKDLSQTIINELQESQPQRNIVDVMSLKRLEGNGTELYLTLKATRNDGGDTSRFEVCEIQVNKTDDSSEKDCFSLESNLPNILLSGDDMTEVAKEAVQELDSLSSSKFMYTLLDILNAEKIVTPGSEGVLTTLELHIAPSFCLKRSDIDELALERQCVENNFTTSYSRMVCHLTRWDRPWKQDTLYSVPSCHAEELQVSTEQVHQVEGSLESSSETQQPVVEESFVAQHVHCTGCPTDLNLDSPALQLLTEQALTQLDEASRSNYKHALVRIIKAQKQVVNGVKYTLHLEVGETSCLKESLEDRSACSVEQDTKTCVFEYLERPWLQAGRELLHSNCTSPLDNNQLENEIEPHHISNTMADRQSIFDYIDAAMDEPFHIRDSPSFLNDDPPPHPIPYGDDGLVDSTIQKEPPLESSEEAMLQPQPKSRHIHQSSSEESEEQADKQHAFVLSTSRQRRGTEQQAPGILKDIDADEKELVKKLGNIAVQTLDELDTDNEKRVVLSVLEAKKQIRNGITYHLKLRVGLTSCPENKDSSLACSVSDTRVCDIQLLQAFASTTPRGAQVVKSECFPEHMPGKRRQKRNMVPGAPQTVDVNDEYIVNITTFALQELDQISSSPYTQKIVRIINATSQVVSGRSVKVTFELGPSSCLKSNNGAQSNETCDLQEGVETQICSVKVWEQPWRNHREVTESKCQSSVSRKKRESSSHSGRLVGAPTDADVNDPYIQELVDFSLSDLDGRTNSIYTHKLIEVVSARKQVVAGTLVHLVLRVGHSTCRKGHNNSSESCLLQENSVKKECRIDVWDRPWLNERRVNNVTCSPLSDGSRRKRSPKIGGGSHDIHFGLFLNFMKKYNKNYESKPEMKKRYHIFRANMLKVRRLQETEQGTAKYGPTKFADLTAKEFKSKYLGLNLNLRHENYIPLPQAKISDVTLPKEFDWRDHNVVTEVKNQGLCGSCWAFSVTGNIEGQYAIQKGKLLSFSEQELVDCDKLDEGCNGGLPENAYKAIEELGGLETESDYPYDGEDEKCHFNRSDVSVRVIGGVNITSNETKMAQWLVKNGPISIGINANAMQFYMGGVSHPWKFLCSPDDLDHGVLIVGYGVHTYPLFNNTMPFWTIKNSWGTSWGEQGYYRVYRGDGTCGVNMMATSAILS